MEMRCLGRRICALALSLCVFSGFGPYVNAAETEDGQGEVRVPIVLEVPRAIAGAEFEIEYTQGLKFLSFEKSEAIRSASTTPVVEKNGKTYFGFYHASNDFVPQNGVLDVGYLVFEYSGEAGQSVTVTEAKYVSVVDKDTTSSELFVINEEIGVPLASGAGLRIAKKSYVWQIVLASAIVVIAAAAFLLYRKRVLTGKAPKASHTNSK